MYLCRQSHCGKLKLQAIHRSDTSYGISVPQWERAASWLAHIPTGVAIVTEAPLMYSTCNWPLYSLRMKRIYFFSLPASAPSKSLRQKTHVPLIAPESVVLTKSQSVCSLLCPHDSAASLRLGFILHRQAVEQRKFGVKFCFKACVLCLGVLSFLYK